MNITQKDEKKPTPLLLVRQEFQEDQADNKTGSDSVDSGHRHTLLSCQKKDICWSGDEEEQDHLSDGDET